MIHFVKKILSVEPYKLQLEFQNGEVKNIDLEAKLKEWSASRESIFKELLEPAYFAKVKLDPELETVYWDNGIDFCPDVLYSMSI